MHNGHYEVEDESGTLRDEFGRHVNRIGKGVYEIIDGTERIEARSDDPNAP